MGVMKSVLLTCLGLSLAAPALASPDGGASLSDADRAAAQAYAKDAYSCTRVVADFNDRLVVMIESVLRDLDKEDLPRGHVKRATDWLDAASAKFKTRPAPAFDEGEALKATLLDYLAFERRLIVAFADDNLKLKHGPEGTHKLRYQAKDLKRAHEAALSKLKIGTVAVLKKSDSKK